jgi:FixJ family two-component response regulator
MRWLAEQVKMLGATNVQPTTYFQLPLLKRTTNSTIYFLDVTMDTATDANDKVEAVLELCPEGALVVIGDGQQGVRVANWIRKGVADYLDWKPTCDDLERSLCIANRRVSTIGSLRYEHTVLAERRQSITVGEEQVLDMVMQGVPNKAIAARLSVSQRTVESRRQKIYQKMGANKLADLIRAIERLERIAAELNYATPTERLTSLGSMPFLAKSPNRDSGPLH